MKTILVATDFSPASLNTVNYAADMALAVHADLYLLHVYQIPVIYSEIPVAMNDEDIRKNAEKEINELKNQLTRKTGGNLYIEAEVRTGVFFQELKIVCERETPYAVVMGSQATSAMERFFFGGHTVYAMRHLMWPIIAVPRGAKFSSVKKIGLACDLDNVIDTTPVDEIRMLVKDLNAELHVLNTCKKEETYNYKIAFESGILDQMLADLKPIYHIITNDDTSQGIMDFTEKNNIDLLIVIPKRHGLLDSLVHSSHTRRWVLHSHVPVMALHRSD